MKIPVFEPVIGEDEISAVAALRRGKFWVTSVRHFQISRPGLRLIAVLNMASPSAMVRLPCNLRSMRLVWARVMKCWSAPAPILRPPWGFMHNGATPVPVDSENITWNLNLDLMEALITPHTKAIIPVHLYGHPVDMDRLMEIARKHDLIVIEDAAEAHGALVRGRKIGSFGDMACFSFYANKIITTGEGGMVLTDNDALAERLRLLRNLGFTTPRFRHEVAGYNFRMTGYQAAMGVTQLDKIEAIIEDKRRVAHTYNRYLNDIPGVQLPVELDWARNVYWMYAITIQPDFGLTRDQLDPRPGGGRDRYPHLFLSDESTALSSRNPRLPRQSPASCRRAMEDWPVFAFNAYPHRGKDPLYH